MGVARAEDADRFKFSVGVVRICDAENFGVPTGVARTEDDKEKAVSSKGWL